jgi:hypothetical protein
VLDILTPKALDASKLPRGLRAAKPAKVEYRRQSYHATRITAKLEAGRKWPDLNLKH